LDLRWIFVDDKIKHYVTFIEAMTTVLLSSNSKDFMCGKAGLAFGNVWRFSDYENFHDTIAAAVFYSSLVKVTTPRYVENNSLFAGSSRAHWSVQSRHPHR
jgi:hypothetical protein